MPVTTEDEGDDELAVMLDAGRGLFQSRRAFISLEPLSLVPSAPIPLRVKHDTSSGHGPRPSRSLRLDSRVPADITPTYPRLRTFVPPYPAPPRFTVCPPARTLRQPCSGLDRTRAISVLVRTTQPPDRPARPGCPVTECGQRRAKASQNDNSVLILSCPWYLDPSVCRGRYA